jgi:hypothetical protein
VPDGLVLPDGLVFTVGVTPAGTLLNVALPLAAAAAPALAAGAWAGIATIAILVLPEPAGDGGHDLVIEVTAAACPVGWAAG